MKIMIAAYDNDHAIGKNGGLALPELLPNDMNRFRKLTMDNVVIMGRRTFWSLPERHRPLEGRQNIVMTMGEFAAERVQKASSLEDAYALAEREDIYVIGGGQIYALAMDTVDKIEATEVDTWVEGADTHFPAIDPAIWHEVAREKFIADKKNPYTHSFVTYLRNHPII